MACGPHRDKKAMGGYTERWQRARMASGGKICAEGKAWAKRTFDTYPSAYANMAASMVFSHVFLECH